MAVTVQIFILLVTVVIVKSHFHQPSPPYRTFTNLLDDVVNGFVTGLLGQSDIEPEGYGLRDIRPRHGNKHYDSRANNAGFKNLPGPSYGIPNGISNRANSEKDNSNKQINYGAGVEASSAKEKPASGQTIGLSNGPQKDKVPVNNVFIVLPVNTNGKSQPDINVQDLHQANISKLSTNGVSKNTEEQIINGDVGADAQESNLLKESKQNKDDLNKVPDFKDDDIKSGVLMEDPELKYNGNKPQEPNLSEEITGNHNSKYIKGESVGSEKLVPGFDNEEMKKGKLMVDPDVKYNMKPDEPKVITQAGDDLNENKVPRFDNDDIEKGILMIDPERNPGLDKFKNSDAILFPGDVKENVQNLPDKIRAGDIVNTVQIVPNNVQMIPANSASIRNLDSNQQVSVNNKNGSPYVSTIQSANDYTVGNISTSSDGISGPVNNNPYANVNNDAANSAQNVQSSNSQNPGQVYVLANSEANNPSNTGYIYTNGNAGVNTPSQVYVLNNGNSGQGYISGATGANNPSQVDVYNNGKLGVNKPAQVYVSYNGNSGVNSAGQSYVLGNYGQPGQVYVLGNPNNYGQNVPPVQTSASYTPVKTSVSPSTNNGYYGVISDKPIYINNGQSYAWPQNDEMGNGQIYVANYKPALLVPNGQTYQVVENNPTGIQVTYQVPNSQASNGNVPLLISYKDNEDRVDKESTEKEKVDKTSEEKSESSEKSKDKTIEKEE